MRLQNVGSSNWKGLTNVETNRPSHHANVETDFFGLEAVNGMKVRTSLVHTKEYNAGRGLRMTPLVLKHEVPANEVEVTLWGQSTYGAPILSFMNRTYEIRGTLRFVATAATQYTVRGELEPSYSAIWIEDSSGNVVGNKIEKRGD